ncbi:MAG: hypothetical protein ACERKO_01010 [Acetanaerobacterium sp.]
MRIRPMEAIFTTLDEQKDWNLLKGFSSIRLSFFTAFIMRYSIIPNF